MQLFISFFLLVGSTFGGNIEDKPVVIVELFTSEGCSSCPPADRLLSSIVNTTYDDVEVIGLSFHVDYWDYIGWSDPYASDRFTQRQRTYARKIRSSQIYTPQMVVNGKHEFVGSSRSSFDSVLKQEKSNKSKVNLNIEVTDTQNAQMTIQVSSDQKEKSLLNVAVVEKDLSQQVTRGENRGRRLQHDNVVRVFTSRQFDGQNNVFNLSLPNDLVTENSSLIVYTQDEESWEVLSAKKLRLIQ